MRTRALPAILALAAILAAPAAGRGSEPEFLAKTFAPSPLFGRAFTWQDVAMLCAAARIPCGVQVAKDETAPSGRLVKRPRRMTVRQGLDALLESHPQYRWEVRDGVVDFLPKAGHLKDYRGSDPLLLRVDSFTAAGVDPFEAALGVCGRLWPAGGWGGSFAFPPGGSRDIDVDLRDVSLRSGLNRIVRDDGNATWELNPQRDSDRFSCWVWSPGKTPRRRNAP